MPVGQRGRVYSRKRSCALLTTTLLAAFQLLLQVLSHTRRLCTQPLPPTKGTLLVCAVLVLLLRRHASPPRHPSRPPPACLQ